MHLDGVTTYMNLCLLGSMAKVVSGVHANLHGTFATGRIVYAMNGHVVVISKSHKMQYHYTMSVSKVVRHAVI